MLKIRAIKIEVNTSNGLFGAEYQFESGLNIIRGNNSTGKSSLFQSILYGLGFEELLGARNEKTMQAVLKDQVEYPKGTLNDVIQSFVYLEIENKETVTIKRSVISQIRKPQLVDVFFGAHLTEPNKSYESKPMYIHDSGGASNELYGFHLFLANFLEWNLPEVVTTTGDLNKLYIQQVAPSFIKEQKSGWSDFMATMPYYGIRNTSARVLEFILNLDVFENEKRKQHIKIQKQVFNNKWSNHVSQLNKLAERSGGTLSGISETPQIINNFNNIFIQVIKDDSAISLNEYNNLQKLELEGLEKYPTGNVGSKVLGNEVFLNELNQKLNQLSLNHNLLSPELNFDKERLKQYEKQLLAVHEDLKKNKGALKVKTLGASLPSEVAFDHCPTCHQDLKDSLLPTDIEQNPMRIEDNIAFLDAQERMIQIFTEGQRKSIKDKEKQLSSYQLQLSEVRQQIRAIQQELISDERLPSVLEIEKRLNLKKRVEFFNKITEDFYLLIEELKLLSKEYEVLLRKEKNLPKDFFSLEDKNKLSNLEAYFIYLLREFNYQSKVFDNITISKESYLPVINKTLPNGFEKQYDIIFDSSASDFIRCIWAYSTALLNTSVHHNSNHPKLLIFDEPKQQDIAMEDFKKFLAELSKYEEQQVLVFASFENSDESFKASTEGLKFHLNQIQEKLIRPI